MKRTHRLILVAFGLACFNISVVVVQAQFSYTTNGGTITITGYTGPESAVIVPSTINGLQVTEIGSNAFTSARLTSITIPSSVIGIGDAAFAECNNLTTVEISDSVTNIGDSAFSSCNNLLAISVDPLNASYSSVAGVLFNKNLSVLIAYPGGKPGNYTVPQGVTSIGKKAFSWSTSLTSLTLGNSITSVGDEAFSWCSGLTSVTIGNSVTSIGSWAFVGCVGLSTISIPNSVTNIGEAAFSFCNNLVAIGVDPLNASYSSVAGVLFDKGRSLLLSYPGGKAGSYTVPEGVTSIAAFAFYQCITLTNVTLGNSVASIGDEAFSWCADLTRMTLGNSVISIGEGAFSYCNRLTGVYFQGNAPSVVSNAFSFADQATVYYLPGTVGWGSSYGGRPTTPWVLPNPTILASDSSFGPGTKGFGFIISGGTNTSVVVEASTNLVQPIWLPLRTNALTSGWIHFDDPDWTNHPTRFYRVRSP